MHFRTNATHRNDDATAQPARADAGTRAAIDTPRWRQPQQTAYERAMRSSPLGLALLFMLGFTTALSAQPQWDFEFSYRTVFDSHADDYLVHAENSQKGSEAPWGAEFWTPTGNQQAAVVRYRFDFPHPASRIYLYARMSAWNYGLGVGNASLWGSTDGTNWTLLLDLPTPTNGIDASATHDADLPSHLCGSNEIWIECRMNRFSGSYRYSGAQFSRMDVQAPPESRSFALRAEYASPRASYTAYRSSCASSAGMPTLRATNPVIGQLWRLTVDSLRPNTAGFLLFALDDRMFGLNRLPLNLDFLGAPDCFVNVNIADDSGVIRQLLPSGGDGVARAVVGIPPDPAVNGFEFFNQYVSLDAPENRALRITTTNAGHGVVGR